MKPSCFFFVLQDENGRPLLVRRGEFLGLPFAWPNGQESSDDCINNKMTLRDVAQRALAGITIIMDLGDIERAIDIDGFEFEGKPVLARVFRITDSTVIAPMRMDASYHFDRSANKPDVFLQKVEECPQILIMCKKPSPVAA